MSVFSCIEKSNPIYGEQRRTIKLGAQRISLRVFSLGTSNRGPIKPNYHSLFTIHQLPRIRVFRPKTPICPISQGKIGGFLGEKRGKTGEIGGKKRKKKEDPHSQPDPPFTIHQLPITRL
jgi:hypothetical protein